MLVSTISELTTLFQVRDSMDGWVFPSQLREATTKSSFFPPQEIYLFGVKQWAFMGNEF